MVIVLLTPTNIAPTSAAAARAAEVLVLAVKPQFMAEMLEALTRELGSYGDKLVLSIAAGIRIARLGRSSVRYELAIFRRGDELACAAGVFVHVYVDRDSNRPVPIPEPTRQLFNTLLVAPA